MNHRCITILCLCLLGAMGLRGLPARDEVLAWGSSRILPRAELQNLNKLGCRYGMHFGVNTEGELLHWGYTPEHLVTLPEIPLPVLDIAIGYSYAVLLLEGGSLLAIGENEYGQCDLPQSNTGFLAVDCWSNTCIALREDGSIVVWGEAPNGMATVPQPNSGFVEIAIGDYGWIALRDDGSVVAPGVEQMLSPWIAAAPFAHIDLAFRDYIGLTPAGRVYAMNLWTGDYLFSNQDEIYTKIAAARWHGYALRSNGDVFEVDDYFGGNHTPLAEGVVQIAAEYLDGYDRCIGLNNSGELVLISLANSTYGEGFPYDQELDVSALFAGSMPLGAVLDDGRVRQWFTHLFSDAFSPDSESGVANVWSNYAHAFALREDGSLDGWGIDLPELYQIPEPNSGFVEVAAGLGYGLGLREDGSICTWGMESLGELPLPEPNADFIKVLANGNIRLAMRSDGSIVQWGDADSLLGEAPASSGYLDFALGWDHALALRADGGIDGWGDNSAGQLDAPTGETYVALTAGLQFSAGLLEEGRILAWGENSLGQCTIPEPNTGWHSLAAGNNYIIALRDEDAVGVASPGRDTSHPGSHELCELYPNPFNPTTQLRFALKSAAEVTLAVFDLQGACVLRRELGHLPAGEHRATWNGCNGHGRNVASGYYLLQLSTSDGLTMQKKGLLLR